MEISNGLNQPVNFYTRSTGNNIKMAVDSENQLLQSNIFAPEFGAREPEKKITNPIKRKRKNKRLNTIDTDYLPDETMETQKADTSQNFFVEKKQNPLFENIRKGVEFFVTNTPLVNYFFLKGKKQRIQKTVEKLNDITQNVDELMNTTVPYGEETNLYHDIAQNLTNAANIIGKANKEM